MKIAVDIGNRNVCSCHKVKGKLFLSSFQARFSTEIQEDYMNSEVIEIDRVKYCIEQGKYDFEFNKSKKEYIPLLLCAIARITKEEQIELMMGTPAEHTLGLRDEFKSKLEGQTFNFKYNGENRKVTFVKVGVIGEGLATYFTIEKSLRKSIKNLGILDIGGRTSNILTFVNGKQEHIHSINIEILDIKNELLTKEKRKGKDYDLIKVENLIESRKLEINNAAKAKLINHILNEIKMYKIDKDLYEWFVTGGGSLDIGDEMLEEQFGDNCIVENALYSNVIGNYNFMVAKWGETSENNQ